MRLLFQITSQLGVAYESVACGVACGVAYESIACKRSNVTLFCSPPNIKK